MSPLGRMRAAVRPRSLRLRALLVVVLVAALPVLGVWATDLADATVGQRLELALSATTRRLERAADRGALDLDDAAHRQHARLTLLDADGAVIAEADHADTSAWSGVVVRRLFREAPPPPLDEIDALRPALADREEVHRARREGHVSGCTSLVDERVVACFSARQTAAGLVYAEQAKALPIRALYDARYQLLKVSLLVAIAALLAGAWLGGRMVRPLEELRRQVLERVDQPLTAEDVTLSREDEFGELAVAFNRLLAEVRDRSAQNEAFVADLAHEMKNPVAAIRAVAESVDSGAPWTEARAARVARILGDSSQRLDALVSQLLELARAEAGLKSEDRVDLDLRALVEGLVAASRADERHQQLQIDAELAEALVHGTPSSLETAIRNVLANALSFASQSVRVVLTAGTGTATLAVYDDGDGLPEDALERVFDRFYTSRGAAEGTGLGLALTRAIVEAHGGAVSAANHADGAVFALTLPLAASPR